jgi:hypothetical protein
MGYMDDPYGSREHHGSFRSVPGGSEWPQQTEKGKKLKFPKLSENSMIMKSVSQDF